MQISYLSLQNKLFPGFDDYWLQLGFKSWFMMPWKYKIIS